MITAFLITLVSAGNFMLYSDGFFEQTDYGRRLYAHLAHMEWQVQPDTAALPEPAAGIMLVGTPESPAFRTHWQELLPFRFSGDTVFVGDSVVVAGDFGFRCRFTVHSGTNIDLHLSRDAEAGPGVPNLFGYDFAIARKRDGPMSAKDLVCCGRLKWAGDRLDISELNWHTLPERRLETTRGRHVRLYHDAGLLSPAEASRILRLLETTYDGYAVQYGLHLPDTVFVYVSLEQAPDNGSTTCSHPSGTIWLRYQDKEQLLHPVQGSPVLTIGHEMSWLAVTPLSNEYPVGIGAHDFSEYGPMVGIIPYVDSVLGDSAWFDGHEYTDQGIPRFERTYRGGEGTYGWILHEVDRKYGKQVIGSAINQVIPEKHWPHPDMLELMQTLALLTGDDSITAQVNRGYPSPFQHSLRSAKKWPDLGLTPTLDKMFVEHRFVVDSVKTGSIADSLGFRPGDTIVEIDGHSTDTEKGRCKAHLLKKPRVAPIEFTLEHAGKQRNVKFTLPEIKRQP